MLALALLALAAPAQGAEVAAVGRRPDGVPPPVVDPPSLCNPNIISWLCLGDGGRFQSSLEVENGSAAGLAQPFQPPQGDLYSSTGFFSIFENDNLEVTVKVLDGCAINGHYWVFAAGTTNVEFVLRVEDRSTGTVREYVNSLGEAAPAITDTEAFAICP